MRGGSGKRMRKWLRMPPMRFLNKMMMSGTLRIAAFQHGVATLFDAMGR